MRSARLSANPIVSAEERAEYTVFFRRPDGIFELQNVTGERLKELRKFAALGGFKLTEVALKNPAKPVRLSRIVFTLEILRVINESPHRKIK